MLRKTFRFGAWTILLIAGIYLLCVMNATAPQVHRPPAPPAPAVAADPLLASLTGPALAPEGGHPAWVKGAEFSIDLSGCLDKLFQLPEEDRHDQVADWALYGALMHANLPADVMRAATFDRLPLRLASMEETVNYEYGPGRRVVVEDEAWLFHAASQTKALAAATVARLADTVRMERGSVPSKVVIFSYRPDLRQDQIVVRCEDVRPGGDLLTPAFGYIEAEVKTAKELESWLNSIDDVTYAALTVGGVRLGGRRFDQVRTAGATLDDVAALYQAHVKIAESQQRFDQAMKSLSMEEKLKAVLDAFNADVSKLNAATSTTVADSGAFERAVDDLNAALAAAGSPAAEQADLSTLILGRKRTLGARKKGAYDLDEALKRFEANGNGFGGGIISGATIESRRSEFEALETRTLTAAKALGGRLAAEWQEQGKLLPAEPGFSLDPQWDVAGLIAGLKRLQTDAPAVIEDAKQVAERAKGENYDDAATPIEVWAARGVVEAFENATPSSYVVPGKWAGQIGDILAAVEGKTGKQAEKGALLPFYQLRESLRRDTGEALQLSMLLRFLESRCRFQAARYDGPMQGTHAGMVLFYTDLLAKLWAGVDYHRSAPVEAVLGFRTYPTVSGTIEPTYLEEQDRLPSTRLWFGPKPEGFSRSPDGAIQFAPVATRVYSAGSNPLQPGAESVASETPRRVFGWWDRHFATVADYEPQYHVQNQIMKWSVITGWLAERATLATLQEVAVRRDYRFDTWYKSNREILKYAKTFRALPPERWIGGTETMEILQSREIRSIRGSHYVAGGVSLGGAKTIGKEATVTAEMGRALGRGGVNYADSLPNFIKMSQNAATKGATFELPPVSQALSEAHVVVSPSSAARLRLGGSELKLSTIDLRISPREIHIDTPVGAIGQLQVRESGNAVALGWKDGTLATDRSLAQRLAVVAELPDSGGWIAGHQQQLPSGGAFVLEQADGPAVVIRPSTAAGGGGGSAGGPPRIIRPISDPPPGPGASVPGFGDGDSYMKVKAGFFGSDGKKVVAKKLSSDAEAVALVTEMKWQRLRSLPDETALDVPAQVERVYTARGPPSGARQVTIKTTDPDFPAVKAFVHDDHVYLEQRADLPPEARARFAELVTRQRITGRQLNRLTSDVKLATLDLAETPGRRFVDRISGSDVNGGLQDLHAAIAEGRVERLLADARKTLIDEVIAGDRTTPSAEFLNLLLGDSTPDAMLAHAVIEAQRGDLPRAAESVSKAVSKGSVDARTTRAMGRALRRAGAGDTGDFVILQADEPVPGLKGKVTLDLAGKRPRTVARDLELEPVSKEEIHNAAAARDVTVYVEDGRLLQQKDWDLMPGRSLAEASLDPTIVIERLRDESVGWFRPSEAYVGEKHYTRTGGSYRVDWEWGSSGAAGQPSGKARPAYVVRANIPPRPDLKPSPGTTQPSHRDEDRVGQTLTR